MQIKEFVYFFPEKPGLIHVEQPLTRQLSENQNWVAELKYNGSRLCLHRLPSGNWELWNRHGEKFSFTPNPELAAALEELNKRLEPDGTAWATLRESRTLPERTGPLRREASGAHSFLRAGRVSGRRVIGLGRGDERRP